MEYNIYCDESCHLENDSQTAMVLGAVWCPNDKVREITKRIREIKNEHGIRKYFEIKWTKVSKAKERFYLDIVNYFFDNNDLHFRGVIIPDKSTLAHDKFKQTHDEWYYKMYFTLLQVIIDPSANYNIYLDIKDTQGGKKVQKLKEALSNNIFDFDSKIINKIQIVRSEEVQLVQLTDLLIGALSYLYRDLSSSEAKVKLIDKIKIGSGYALTKTTLLREGKFNILVWNSTQ